MGLVSSSVGDPTPERGGRAKRFFRVTAKGLKAVKDTQRALVAMWTNVPALGGVLRETEPATTIGNVDSGTARSAERALVGDLAEEYRAGRSAVWYWWQVLASIVVSAGRQQRAEPASLGAERV